MKHWSAGLLIAVVLGVGAYFVWPAIFPEGPGVKHFGGKAPVLMVPGAGDSVEEAVAALHDEFFKHQAIKPSLEARQRIQELAALGPKGNKMVLILDDWLRQMFNAGQADSEEFRELAVALLAVDPEAPRRVVKRHYDTHFDVDMEFCGKELMAFGKPALPAVLEGISDEAGHADRVKFPEKSKLPAVLAGFGPDAMPGILTALDNESPYVRGQALRALGLMKADQASKALPALRRLGGQDQPAEIRAAALGLLDKIEHN